MNVILLVNDTFRRDHLGCYGNPWIKTPNLDAFAHQSALFDQYYIGSYPTVPNRWDMLVGRFGFPSVGWEPLRRQDRTLAQILGKHGVHTHMIWDTPMLAMHDYNYTRGFKGIEFIHSQKGDPWITSPDLPIQLTAQPHKIKNTGSMTSYLRNHYGRRYEREFCTARTMSGAMDWLETNYKQDSFFLYVDMWDPHEPFDSPWFDYQLYADPDYSGDRIDYPQYGRYTYMTPEEHQDVRALYAGGVTFVDRWVGRFLDLAERLGLYKDTLIIWTTDHGHLFGEHNLHGKPGAEMGKLYEITTRIPLLVRHPEGLGAGKRMKGIVQPADLMPSILEFMEIPVPDEVDGRSFWSLVNGESDKGRSYAFSNRYPQMVGADGAAFDGWVGTDRVVEPGTVTSDTWAMINAPQGLPSELYNIAEDPDQMNNVIDAYPEIAQKMRKVWLQFLKDHGASEERIRPFVEGNVDPPAITKGMVYAFRDDLGQLIAYPTERAAKAAAYLQNAPGPKREVIEITYDSFLADNSKNLIHLFDQFYWAEDLI
ncbi:MAG: sulfatase [Anaerolineae bacterium]|nr:sulfatase [Anaerolineae bacterium]